MKSYQRKRILVSLASKKAEKLNGRHSRKSVEKYLEKNKKLYTDMKKALTAAESQLSGISSLVDNYRKNVEEAREAILSCHEIMKKMDMVGATDVKIKDNQDIAYLSDGRWIKHKEDGSTVPLSEWKKQQEKEVQDVNDLNEGFEITE